MDTVETILRAYGAAWQERDEAARRAHLDIAWADDGVYSDPSAEATGREALAAHIGRFQAARPDARIELVGGADGHHRHLRFAWRMLDGDGAVALDGIDFATLDDDGRLVQVVGFFGARPPA